jgi:hypothetical protein
MRKQTESELHSEAHAFTDLTKKLLAVPKKEIDAQKAKYNRSKERKNEKRAK